MQRAVYSGGLWGSSGLPIGRAETSLGLHCSLRRFLASPSSFPLCFHSCLVCIRVLKLSLLPTPLSFHRWYPQYIPCTSCFVFLLASSWRSQSNIMTQCLIRILYCFLHWGDSGGQDKVPNVRELLAVGAGRVTQQRISRQTKNYVY